MHFVVGEIAASALFIIGSLSQKVADPLTGFSTSHGNRRLNNQNRGLHPICHRNPIWLMRAILLLQPQVVL